MDFKIEIYKLKYKKKENSDEIRILGYDFTEKNRNKGRLVLNNKKFPLNSLINIKDMKKSQLTIILNKNVYDKSFMFQNCETLEAFQKLSINDDFHKFKNNCIIQDYEQINKNDTETELIISQI